MQFQRRPLWPMLLFPGEGGRGAPTFTELTRTRPARHRTITWTFVVSIFMLNLANTFATAIDFTATRSSAVLHRLLYCSIFFRCTFVVDKCRLLTSYIACSVGMLMYSINTTGQCSVDCHVDERRRCSVRVISQCVHCWLERLESRVMSGMCAHTCCRQSHFCRARRFSAQRLVLA
jgi:hypothetical protein